MTNEQLPLGKFYEDINKVDYYVLPCSFCSKQGESDLHELACNFYDEIKADGWKYIDTGTHRGVACPDCIEAYNQGEL